MAGEEYRELRLAHLSVRDYLLSQKILSSTASYFYITEAVAQRSIAEACIVYLQQFDTQSDLPTYDEAIRDTPLARYAARYWSQHVQDAIKAANAEIGKKVFHIGPGGVEDEQKMVIFLIIQFLIQMLKLLGVPVSFSVTNKGDELKELDKLCVEFLVSQGQSQIRFFDPDTPWLAKPDVSRPLTAIPSALYTAAQAGFLEPVRQLLRQGMDPNPVGGRYGTPLQAAACKGYPKIVSLLLESGADPNFRAGDYFYPLQGASAYGQEECVNILLAAGANIDASGGDYHTALHAAAFNGHRKIIEILAAHGVDLDAREPKENRTPLTIAASQGHTAVVEFLLKRGVDIFAKDAGGWTALDESAPAGFEGLSEILIKHNPEILKSVDKDNHSALHHTASQNFPACVEVLLRNGIDHRIRTSRNERTAFYKAVKSGNLEVVELFLKYGTEVAIEDSRGWTPLHIAAYYGFVDIGELLLEHGADVNLGPGGFTPLHIAVLREHVEFVELLLENNADTTITTMSGQRAIDFCEAIENYQNQAITGRLYISENFLTISGLRAAATRAQNVHIRGLLERGADINGTDDGGYTALYWAACEGHNETVRLLIESGADVNIRTEDGKSIMDCWLNQESIDLAYEYGYKDKEEEDESADEWSRRLLISKEIEGLIEKHMPRK
ncbi:Ankyrin-2 [Arthrobotrys entomopaga]|nr:Ankyrin-2 [Arthrobotrys entomopaga]